MVPSGCHPRSRRSAISVGLNPLPLGNFIKRGKQPCSGVSKTFSITVNPSPGFGKSVLVFPDSLTVKKFPSTDVPVIKFSSNSDTGIKVYPNPVKDKLYIENVDGNYVEIINALGQVINLEMLSTGKTLEIDTQNMPSGVYYVKVKLDDMLYSKKFVKQE